MMTHIAVCGQVVLDTHCSMRQVVVLHVRILQYVSSLLLRHSTCSRTISLRQHTSACVSIRQHTSAYVSIRQHTSYLQPNNINPQAHLPLTQTLWHRDHRLPDHSHRLVHMHCIRQHTSAYVSSIRHIRQQIRQHTRLPDHSHRLVHMHCSHSRTRKKTNQKKVKQVVVNQNFGCNILTSHIKYVAG
jgi:hypothetical protein